MSPFLLGKGKHFIIQGLNWWRREHKKQDIIDEESIKKERGDKKYLCEAWFEDLLKK